MVRPGTRTGLSVVAAAVAVHLLGGCGMHVHGSGDDTLTKADGEAHYEALLDELKGAVRCGGDQLRWEADPRARTGLFDLGDGRYRYHSPLLVAPESCNDTPGEFDAAVVAIERVLDGHGGAADKVVTAAHGSTGTNEVHWKDAHGGEIVFGSFKRTTLSVQSGDLTD